jgi:hypothetical protein
MNIGKDWKAKLESAYSFQLTFTKITVGELIYTWKTLKLESRLGSNLTFSSGSVT